MRVLCLHGLGGTGATMWPIVATLSRDHVVLAPTLPGHGGAPEELRGVGWAEWLATARSWPADVIIGQSMGGSLALQLAAEGACQAVVAINPLAPDPDGVEGLEWRIERGHEWADAPAAVSGEVAHDRVPLTALLEMARGVAAIDLGAVSQPLLLVTSADDDVVDPASSDAVAAAVSGPVTRCRLANGGHTASLGPERDRLTAAIAAFVQRQV